MRKKPLRLADPELEDQRAFARHVHGLLVHAAGRSLPDIYLTRFMSCAMPTPQRGFHSVGNYNINVVVGDKASKCTAASMTELRAVHFCKNVLLTSSSCTIARRLSNTNDISIIYMSVPKTIQYSFKLLCNPKKTSP